jgi:predicted nucleic-acid-binding protein
VTDIIDTNIIVRVISRDPPDLAERALRYLALVRDGQRTAFIPEAVLLEVVQVLSLKNLYMISRPEIQQSLEVVLNLRGIRMSGKALYRRALQLYASTTLDFADTLNIAYLELEGRETIVSFDRGYDRVPTARRLEPT